MVGVIFMLNDKGPLMFINTVNTQVEEIPQQKLYDSRTIKDDKERQNLEKIVDEESPNLKYLGERKLRNIIEMYNKGRPVLCNIICDGNEILGIPFKKNEDYLFVKISEEGTKEIKLNRITDIIIIKF